VCTYSMLGGPDDAAAACCSVTRFGSGISKRRFHDRCRLTTISDWPRGGRSGSVGMQPSAVGFRSCELGEVSCSMSSLLPSTGCVLQLHVVHRDICRAGRLAHGSELH
jgi:hypothetical protein